MELTKLEPLRLHTSLLEKLRSDQKLFENWIRHVVVQYDVNVNFVHPHPLNKTLLEVACCEGRVKSVELLLKLGANVNRLNDVYNRAPIHFAAEVGHADVLRVLLQEKRCNPNLEIEKQTALQIAVGNDSTNCVRVLLEYGANPNLEIENQTALHIAVGNDSTDCVRVLLEYGANPNIANSEGLTPIYIAAMKPNREVVQLILKIPKFLPNLDDFQDRDNLTTRQILQKKFPDLDVPTARESKIDIKEFCRFGFKGNELDFLENLRRIPDYQLSSDNIRKMTLNATACKFPNAIRELLKKGQRNDCFLTIAKTVMSNITCDHSRFLGEILTIDAELANTLLLLACEMLGGTYYCNMDRKMCLEFILREPNINVRCEDKCGFTPLHYVARAGDIDMVNRLLELGSSLGHRNIGGMPPLAYMSHDVLSNIFDDCIVRAKADEYEMEFNYRSLIAHIAPSQRPDEVHEEFLKSYEKMPIFSEMEALTYIAESRDLQQLLNHPLLSSFLYLKWHRIWPVLCANFVFYVIFYALINYYILSTNHAIDTSSSSPPNSSNLTSPTLHTNFQQLNAVGALTAIFLILLAMRETFQLISSPKYYLLNLKNILELVLIVLGVWTLITPNPQISAFVILLSALELVILIGQYPPLSTGIEMLKIVTITFIRFLSLYAILIIAFALAFSTLFCNTKNNVNFLDLGHSLFKTIIMLTGEFDANDIPFMSYPVLSRCIFVLFIFLMAIIVLNLLNGLAVSDTSAIIKKSETVALISRVKLVSYIERVAIGWGRIKFAGLCFSGTAICRSMFKPPGFLAMRTLLFSGYLPERKISIKPNKSNKIFVDGTRSRSRIVCSMEPLIVHRAREILLQREARMFAEKGKRKNINDFDTIKAKLEELQIAIYESGLGNVRKSL